MQQRIKSLAKRAVIVTLSLVLLGNLLRACSDVSREAPGSRSATAAAPLRATVQQERSGVVKLVPGGHRFTATTFDGRTLFNYEPPLPRNDGSMYGAMNDAVTVVFGSNAGHFFGSKLTNRTLPNGKVALALEADEYWYLALPLGVSDEDTRIGAMAFWRESK